MKILIIVLIIIVILIIFLYNHLVRLNIRCKNAWSQIDNQLKRRFDLIPNLVEITKGYAKHESQTLVDVVNARNEAKTLSDIAKNSEEISNNIKNLFALSENYPDLKANELFKNLQIELTGTEDKIAFARQFYNDAVLLYKNKLEMFPSNIIASLFKFQPEQFFEATEEDRKVPEVKF